MRFQDRVAIVTGAGGGIGEAYARALHAEGASVVIAELNETAGQAVADELGERALFVCTDVGDPAGTDALAAATVERFGGIDHLVNNAAIFGDMELAGLTNVDYAYLDRFLKVNLLGALHCTRSCLRGMKGRPGASIVNQSSTAAWMGISGFYGLAKAGVNFLTASLAQELGPRGIRVNAIAPGPTQTAALAKQVPVEFQDPIVASLALKRLGTPDDHVGPVLFLLSDEARWITGHTLSVDGGQITRI
ncbi:MAG: SDR family oxidoreductase [Acidimicrobiales bacterium]|jgi:NAD(P)-dependent dehydrogenase (short-subunit alcohol dehydrogenase family)|nr:SDR family oxidoreductase [Acidimicrobiales bacterium]